MPDTHHYWVYIVASRSRTLYVGVTNDIVRRVEEHRAGTSDSFTARYRIHRLVFLEHYTYVRSAILREEQLKGWLRERKVALIASSNPTWHDLYPELVGLHRQEAGPSLRSG